MLRGRNAVKRIFRKNQVIITALAIMIVVAGYLDHVQKQKKNADELAETSASLQEMADMSAEDLGGDTTGEALLVSGMIQNDIFAAAKLSREQMRAKNKETLTALIENEEVAETQREEAVAAMIALTDVAERENAAEVLLQAKGFGSVVVNITEESVDVCVGAAELTDSQVAQIQDIVERKTGIGAKNTVITLASSLTASGTDGEAEEVMGSGEDAEDTVETSAASGDEIEEATPTTGTEMEEAGE